MSEPFPPVAISDPNRGYEQWLISEIYTGSGTGRYVPNVNDSVMDWTQGLLRVVSVDYTTGLSVLEPWNTPVNPGEGNDDDILLGAGPGTITESYRVLLNTNVVPYVLSLDSILHMYGTQTSYCKVFKGTNIGQNGEVISAFYDQSGNLLGENIPLELSQHPDPVNRAIKNAMVGYTSHALPDGEIVTAVFYTDAGQAVSIRKMVIVNTGFVRTTDASKKYISAISLETPFLSASNPKLIQYPINMPVANLNLIGVVTYSDGSKIRLPVDGTKFEILGLTNYIATIQGQEVPTPLVYHLGPNEYSYILGQTVNGNIVEPYRATTLASDGAYNVKLFAYPVWIDALNGYRLEYYLYNLDREDRYDVTNLIEMANGSAAFDPIQFGTIQHIAVSLLLSRVNPAFASYRHVQSFDITLRANGNDATQDNWTVAFSPGQVPPYGAGVQAVAQFINVNNWRLDLSCGETTLEDWLEKVYYATQPLVDTEAEIAPPVPNFFVVQTGTHRVEVPIAQWNTLITAHEVPNEGGIVTLEFLRRGSATDLQLGISGMVVHYQDPP